MLAYMKKTGKVEALNASGPAPKRATIEYFREHGHAKVPTEGPLSIAVPGAVDGWTELHKRYGTLELTRTPPTRSPTRATGFRFRTI